MGRTMGLGLLLALALLPAAADAATYCVGSPPGCSGIGALNVEAAISAATLGPTVEDDVIQVGAGTWPANHLRIPANDDGTLTVVGQGAGTTQFTRATVDPIAQVNDDLATIRDLGLVVPGGGAFDRALELYRGSAQRIAVTDTTGSSHTGIVMADGAHLADSTVAMTTASSTAVEVFNIGNALVERSQLSGCTGLIGNTTGAHRLVTSRVDAARGVRSLAGSMLLDSTLVRVAARNGCDAHSAIWFSGDFAGGGRSLSSVNVTAIGPGPTATDTRAVRLERTSGAAAMMTLLDSSAFTGFTFAIERSGVPAPQAEVNASALDVDTAPGLVPGATPNLDEPVLGFTDPAAGDYTLTAASALVDRGRLGVESGESAMDLRGRPRHVDGKPAVNGTAARRDIGAFEYEPGLPAVTAAAVADAGGATFTATGDAGDPGEALSYRWTFDDGTSADGASVVKALAPGPHTATVTVTDASGWTASAAVAVTVPATALVPGPAPGAVLPAPAPRGPAGARPRLTLPAQSPALDRRGRVGIRLRCPAGGARCTGTLVLRATKRVRVKGRQRLVTFGRATFAVPPGREATVRVRVSSRALLRRLRRVAVTADAGPMGTARATLAVRVLRR